MRLSKAPSLSDSGSSLPGKSEISQGPSKASGSNNAKQSEQNASLPKGNEQRQRGGSMRLSKAPSLSDSDKQSVKQPERIDNNNNQPENRIERSDNVSDMSSGQQQPLQGRQRSVSESDINGFMKQSYRQYNNELNKSSDKE